MQDILLSVIVILAKGAAFFVIGYLLGVAYSQFTNRRWFMTDKQKLDDILAALKAAQTMIHKASRDDTTSMGAVLDFYDDVVLGVQEIIEIPGWQSRELWHLLYASPQCARIRF